ncbi:surface carbohydrate biosynthesis protein [Verrucomicrobiaceae bacterium 227]
MSSTNPPPSHYTVVILVDLKKRDLMGCVLMAHQLKKLGVTTHLEPLESWRSCLYAWKPDMVIFNHLLHKHITDLSEQLKRDGILVACLLNEGLCLKDSARAYLSEPQFPNVHCDLFLTWNELHRDALIKTEFVSPKENAVVTGCPRFDFYHEPWSNFYRKERTTKLTSVLVNTTFALAHFFHRSPEERQSLFRALGDGKIPEALDYNQLIEDHYHGRNHLINYLRPLLASGDFQITLRPHPREEIVFYEELIAGLPADQQNLISIDQGESVFGAILNSDIVLNCEDCTTSVESWISKKPTLTLIFEKNPVFLTPVYLECSPTISDPDELLPAMRESLADPTPEAYQAPRKAYLKKWLYQTDGQNARRCAEAIRRTLDDKKPTPKYPFNFSGIRRGLKLRFLRLLNEPGHSKPQHIIKRLLWGERAKMSIRYRDYLKAVRPSDAREALEILAKLDPETR